MVRCVNCGDVVHGRANSRGRGPDIAWHAHCQPCAALVADQMERLDLLPEGSGVEIYRCRSCGTRRICRTGWRTRCHICLDERSAGYALAAGERLLARVPHEPAHAAQLRQFGGLTAEDDIPVRVAAEFQAAIALGTELDRRRRDGWDDLTGDVHGLPWHGERTAAWSHGTWGVHDRCGAWQRFRDRACPQCPPEPGDRSFAALRDTPICCTWSGIEGCSNSGSVARLGYGSICAPARNWWRWWRGATPTSSPLRRPSSGSGQHRCGSGAPGGCRRRSGRAPRWSGSWCRSDSRTCCPPVVTSPTASWIPRDTGVRQRAWATGGEADYFQ